MRQTNPSENSAISSGNAAPSPFFGERYHQGSAIIVTGTNTIVIRLTSD